MLPVGGEDGDVIYVWGIDTSDEDMVDVPGSSEFMPMQATSKRRDRQDGLTFPVPMMFKNRSVAIRHVFIVRNTRTNKMVAIMLDKEVPMSIRETKLWYDEAMGIARTAEGFDPEYTRITCMQLL
jgi:hypothetical protein